MYNDNIFADMHKQPVWEYQSTFIVSWLAANIRCGSTVFGKGKGFGVEGNLVAKQSVPGLIQNLLMLTCSVQYVHFKND